MLSRTPFGNPDGSRSDIQEVVDSFVSLDQHNLAVPGDDLSARIVVGAKGSGKTVYLRRLRATAADNGSVYAGTVQQDLPVTSNIVKFCQCFRRRDLTEKWMQLWYCAILRSLISHLSRARPLAAHLTEEQREELEQYPPEIVPRFRREVSVYSQVTDIITRHHTDRAFSQDLDDPAWAELATTVSDILAGMPPVYFFIDSVDEEYANAPMFWLQCQKGLFFRTMRFLRDQHFGGRLHVIACVRDHVMASVLRGEHQNRYRGEPHITSLDWDYGAAEFFLTEKIERLDRRFVMRDGDAVRTAGSWLGLDEIENPGRGIREPITEYLLRHTRLLPRDVVILGNRLSQEVALAKENGDRRLAEQVVRRCVREAAYSFGNEQLAICANHIASSGMPSDAARREYDEIYTGDSEFSRGIHDRLVELIQLIGKDRFGADELEAAALQATELFGEGSDALSVLWQNRLLGYTDASPDGVQETFFSSTSCEHFVLPRDKREYLFHSALIDRVGIQAVGAPVGQAAMAKRTSRRRPAAAAAAARPGALPLEIGGHRIVERIGQGGMGVVYLAEDTKLQRRIAIKVLPDGVARDPARLARFEREARLLAKLNHPNIAVIHSLGERRGQSFLTMEYVPGSTLHEVIREGPVGVARSLRLARQIAEAIQAAHGRGVVHRDLKPTNIMVTAEDQVKVLDFGLAKALAGEDGAKPTAAEPGTGTGVVPGTPGYMSPEHLRSLPVDGRADVWGFGCTLFECLAGQPAFPGDTPAQRITASLEREPDWSALPRRTPRRAAKLLRQCLEKEPSRRIDIAAVVAQLAGS